MLASSSSSRKFLFHMILVKLADWMNLEIRSPTKRAGVTWCRQFKDLQESRESFAKWRLLCYLRCSSASVHQVALTLDIYYYVWFTFHRNYKIGLGFKFVHFYIQNWLKLTWKLWWNMNFSTKPNSVIFAIIWTNIRVFLIR